MRGLLNDIDCGQPGEMLAHIGEVSPEGVSDPVITQKVTNILMMPKVVMERIAEVMGAIIVPAGVIAGVVWLTKKRKRR